MGELEGQVKLVFEIELLEHGHVATELERGVDNYGYWYKSPGDKTTGGDPGRPDDPAEYIGLVAKPVAEV